MKKRQIHTLLLCIGLAGMLSSCGEDRSGEYYALIADKTWIYETMQKQYLFYEDLPAEDRLDFFMKPDEFVKAAASSHDQKNGVVFSHADSVFTTRTRSEYPCFGMEVDFASTPQQGTPVMRVLYVQPNSPADKQGLKRGDWIIAVDSAKVSASNYEEYIVRPTQAHEFMLGKYIPPKTDDEDTEGNEEESDIVEFDTLRTVTLNPVYVEQKNLLEDKVIEAGNGRKALYLLYNKFGKEDIAELQAAFTRHQGFEDIILDLRYNPGGYVETSQVLSTYLAPQDAIGQPFLNMTYNDKIGKTETWLFEKSLLSGGVPVSYDNLYVITSGSTASSSEIVINCLKPYMKERLFQVGAATFGKNVAQQLFTNEEVPQIELWLTTTLLSNSEQYSDYFKEGLLPDFDIEENTIDALGEFGTANDRLLQPVLYRMEHGIFPSVETPEEPGEAALSRKTRVQNGFHIIYNPTAFKPKWNKLGK